MKPTQLGQLLKGIAVTAKPELMVNNIVIDSRKVEPGDLFIAIKGENFNGNDFAESAFKAGACAAVVSELCGSCDGEQILVSDTQDALGRIAANYRELFNIKSVAITGSVGKTTTKDMTAAVLERFGHTLKTFGNFNNNIGMPLTMLRLDDSDRFASIEMGMSNFGEISPLSKILKPDVAILTRIGISHIEFLGTQENILKAKLEILDGMNESGVLVVNADDPIIMGNLHDVKQRIVTFSGENNEEADVSIKNIRQVGGSTEFVIHDKENGMFKAIIPALGKHNVADAAAAYAAVTRMGLAPEIAAAGLADYEPSGMRQKVVEYNGITIIEDCYNAAPESMRASLSILRDFQCKGLKIAVLGDMNELGDETVMQHRLIGMEVARCGIDILICCGEKAAMIADDARAGGVTIVEHFKTNKEVAEYLRKSANMGDCILFKASRAMKFEEIISMFKGEEEGSF